MEHQGQAQAGEHDVVDRLAHLEDPKWQKMLKRIAK